MTTNSPLPGTVYLQSVDFLRAVSGTGTAGQLFIDIYTTAGSGGTYLGSSTNSIDVNSATGLSTLTWNFNNIALSSGTQHAFVFSTDNVAGGFLSNAGGQGARLQVARDSGGTFGNSYTAGTADNDSTNASPSAFDTRFQVTLDTVPEPSAALLGGLGVLALLRRRRA